MSLWQSTIIHHEAPSKNSKQIQLQVYHLPVEHFLLFRDTVPEEYLSSMYIILISWCVLAILNTQDAHLKDAQFLAVLVSGKL